MAFFPGSVLLMSQIHCIFPYYSYWGKEMTVYALCILTWRSLHIKLSLKFWFFRPITPLLFLRGLIFQA